jgi:diguanylate cyclase (GGDEF)-like protein
VAGDEAGSPELRRAERRLDRERRAREEAERISEQVTRALYTKSGELALLEAVATASNEARTVEDALQVAVERVCEFAGWPVGHALVRDAVDDELASSGTWHFETANGFDGFKRATEALRFPSGIGLPGRVMAAGEAAWIIDVTQDPNFPRAPAARECGLKAAFGFPVSVGGEVRAVLEFFSPETVDPDDALLGLMAHIGNQLATVLDRKCGEQERQRLMRQTEALLTSAGEGICGTDAEGGMTFVNPAATRMLGLAADRPPEGRFHDLVHGALPDGGGHGADGCPLHPVWSSRKSSPSREDLFAREDGSSFPVEYIRTPILEGDRITGAVVTFNDITERKRFESQLQHLADHDALTGLFNRRRFEQELERQTAYATRYGAAAAVLMVDLDNFKHANDTFGHHTGDEVIRSVAGLLRKRLRETDTLARMGGDEFAVLLPNADEPTARDVAQTLLDAVRGHHLPGRASAMRVTASIGIAPLTDEEVTAEELLVRADQAMYQAKDAGRDGIVLYSAETPGHPPAGAGLGWADRIREALEHDRFTLYCQPIFDLASDKTSQYEILLRLVDEDGTVVLPGAFLPPAERFGLIQEIDRWVVGEAIRLAAAQRARGHELELLLEINLSGKSVGDPELPRLIERELVAAGVPPSSLIFEITETAAIANMDEARRFAERLTQLGCRLALDDFGAGFGSFYYLKYLTLDYLKIDGDFVQNLPRSPLDQRMVKAMVEVARGLEMKTIAEFVGDAETVELLRELGIDYAQGYHIGHPVPAATLFD